MASPRVEYRTARLVVVATAVLALAVSVIGTMLLIDDFQTRRDQRQLAEETSVESLSDRLDELDADLARALSAIEEAGFGNIGDPSVNDDAGIEDFVALLRLLLPSEDAAQCA